MDIEPINAALDRIYGQEEARIVFWNDPEREFTHSLPYLLLEDLEVLKLDEIGSLEAKVRIERDQPESKFLLYSASEEPEYDDDWLLDIRLYSRSFRADRASLLLDELGLAQKSLRQHLSLRRKFFDSKERLRRLKGLVVATDSERDLDRKMLAVVTKADQPELFNIVRTLLHSMAEGDDLDLDVVPAAWEQVEKFDLDGFFWDMVAASFGYSDGSPSLQNLLIHLLVSDYSQHLVGEPKPSLQHFQLPRSGAANAVVCLGQWRDSSSAGGSYNVLAETLGKRLGIAEDLHDREIESLLDVVTFPDTEKAIVKGLLERVTGTSDAIDADAIRDIVSRRQARHWVASSSIPEPQRRARWSVYEALGAASNFFALRNERRDGFDFADAAEMYREYTSAFFRFDQLYRHFCEHADVAAAQGWDMLKPLRGEVEACYCNWYLPKLNLAWGKFLGQGLLGSWRLDGVPNQYRFFATMVKKWTDLGEKRRAFVIVSDAFRYEIAEELTRVLNGTYRIEADLSSRLGVLPSVTALGMASLLPYKALEYTTKAEVLLDGKPTASLVQRGDVLDAVGGIAVKAGELLAMKKEEGRELVADKRVVYIYHDEIDATGDKTATEGNTFRAARKAIEDLGALVRYVVNSLNGNYVLVTADHGFLFTESAPNETDKSKLLDKPPGTVKAKKRYLLGFDLPETDEAWHGTTEATAKAQGGMEFWVPKGTNRFHFSGGARFIHGGASLQEVVVPVITVKHLKDKKSRVKTETAQVTVQVLGAKHRITAPKHRFKLIQMEPVSDRIKPVTLKVAVYDEGEPVTSIETVTFDSASGSLDDRQKSVILTLQDRQYDKNTPYRLVLREAETGIEQQSHDVIIDRAISDDFNF